jgi:phosphomannomutase
LINCTASHNPPEWQGIKFNPRLGYPAPTNVTDFIASRINEIQLLDQPSTTVDLDQAEKDGRLHGFDPIDHYTRWIRNSGVGNQRVKIDFERIRKYFGQHLVVVDEMHGASRGYLTRLLGEIGIRYAVIHAETDPTLPGLDYANPEEPFINLLKEKVKETGAILGLGMDTDADRFGVVDQGGVYFRPNQILPIVVRYLGVDRGLKGRVIATQTGSPLIEPLAGKIKNNEMHKPDNDVIPAYIDHPFYRRRVGQREDRFQTHLYGASWHQIYRGAETNRPALPEPPHAARRLAEHAADWRRRELGLDDAGPRHR